MKVLWLCNTLIPEIAKQIGVESTKPESWLSGMYQYFRQKPDFELIYLFPTGNKHSSWEFENSTFIHYKHNSITTCEIEQVEEFEQVLNQYNPDVIHIFGTEYPHTLAMIKASEKAGMLDRVVISIQGLVSVCANHYYAFLPASAVHSYTLRDVLKRNNIFRQKKSFEKRGIYEIEALKRAKHIIGRTDWDSACTEKLNSNREYHFCNETLRPTFYENKWDLDKCEKHSIFVSQSNYPIKGFHLMLEAMADIVKAYPDAHLYTTGSSPINCGFKQKIKQTYYSKYLGKLIRKYGLEQKVTFLGYLDEKSMCDQYLKSHVFVSPSSIENSPNSVGEAMILGVPTVSSDVGGVKNMLEHNKDGFVYQADAPYMLAYYVKRIFENDDLARELSGNARKHAEITHDREKNIVNLLEIYGNISNK